MDNEQKLYAVPLEMFMEWYGSYSELSDALWRLHLLAHNGGRNPLRPEDSAGGKHE